MRKLINIRHRLMKWILGLAAAGFLVLVASLGVLYARIAAFEAASSGVSPERADVGIVLGAALWNDRPSPALRERLDHAIALYRSGVVSRLIVSGGLDDEGATITEAEGMRNYLLEQGIPDHDIFMERASRSTVENLLFSRAIMDDEGWDSAVIVTHDYHGARAADIAASLDFDPVQVSVTESRVLNMTFHRLREVLAFAKWELTKLRHALL
jgi:uncharacterized SAM-binding protein YcdF (DUF218 family)